MYSKAKIAGHPIHPMLIPFPITFYTVTVAALIAFTQTGDGFWFRVAIYANFAGVVTAALAAIPGAIDALAGIPNGTRARSTALIHGGLNATTLVLFVVSLSQLWTQRLERVPNVSLSLVLGCLGIVLMLVAGALGWKLVQTHHVGVEPRSAEERDDGVAGVPGRTASIPRNAP
jgi:uncharacterized membrane protein